MRNVWSICLKSVGLTGFVVYDAVVTDASADATGSVLDRIGVGNKNRKMLIEKIRSDGWRSYGEVTKDKDIEHPRIILMNPKMAGHLLPWTHRFISNIKAVLKGPHRDVLEKHLQRYLFEACYRFNQRYWNHQIFDRLLFACTDGKSIPRNKILVPNQTVSC